MGIVPPLAGCAGLGSALPRRWMGGCEISLTDPYAAPPASNAPTLGGRPCRRSGLLLGPAKSSAGRRAVLAGIQDLRPYLPDADTANISPDHGRLNRSGPHRCGVPVSDTAPCSPAPISATL